MDQLQIFWVPGTVREHDNPLAVLLAAKERRGPSSGCDSPRASSLSNSQTKPPFSLLPPEEFLPFVVPFQGGTGVLAGGCDGGVAALGLGGLDTGPPPCAMWFLHVTSICNNNALRVVQPSHGKNME